MSDPNEPTVEIPPHVSLRDLEPWEQHIWRTPDLTVRDREVAILLIRLAHGVLDDAEGLDKLHDALGKVLKGRTQP